jgi:hypothetical protein
MSGPAVGGSAQYEEFPLQNTQSSVLLPLRTQRRLRFHQRVAILMIEHHVSTA